MNDTLGSPSYPQPGDAGNSGCLLLAQDGRVVTADAGAAELWHRPAAELKGVPFAGLFQFDVVSQDPDWLNFQWEALASSAAGRPFDLQLARGEAEPQAVTVWLERVDEEPPRYLARVVCPVPPAEPAPEPIVAAKPGSEPDFTSLLPERSPVGFFDLNLLENTARYSPGWLRLLGIAPQDSFAGVDACLALVHPDDSDALPLRAGHSRAVGRRPFSEEYRMRHASGQYRWYHAAGVQVFGPNGALQRVVGVQLDIQERKEIEEDALLSDERLRLFGGIGQAGLFDLDLQAGEFWCSAGLLSLLGYPTDEPAGSDVLLHALPLEEATDGLTGYFLLQHPDEPAYCERLRLRHRSGHEIPVAVSVVRRFSRQRELERITGCILPIAGQGEAGGGEALTGTIETLLNQLPLGVVMAQADGRIARINAKAAQLLGLDEEAAVGRLNSDLFRLRHRASNQPGEDPVEKVIATGEALPLTNEFNLEGPDGRPQQVAWSCHPVPGDASRLAGAVLIFRNPLEMRLTPDELVRSNRFDALGHLAGSIAHDYNNLLTTILGGVSLAKDNRNLAGLENSERACLAAKDLSKQLLTFAKGGTGVRQVVRAGDLVRDAVKIAAAASVVRITVNEQPDLPAIRVDHPQMLQVLQNLIINSIQAMPGGRGNIAITLATTAVGAGEVPPLLAGKYITIAVADDGSGIKPENLEKIFSPFYTTKKTGTGLGLSTVASIVRRHDGQVGVESELGKGTTFTVFLPPADQDVEAPVRAAPSISFATRTGRILFMDDDPQIAFLTGAMLESLGYKYDLAKNGEEAVQLYKRYLNIGRPYDVVLLDLTIVGGMGGEETFRQLRELHPQVRAVIASGYDNEEMRKQYLDLGLLDYLCKPYRSTELGRCIKRIVGA